MSALKPRTDLPKPVENELAEILLRVRVPQIKSKLIGEFLTERETRLLGEKLVSLPDKQVSAITLLRVVARQRKWSLERALIESALAVDLLGFGGYQTLRHAIGEPVEVAPREIPQWDADAGTLRFRGKAVRELITRAKNCRLILGAFQEDGWPARIDSPLPRRAKRRSLGETVRILNENLLSIRFFCDGTGTGVTWQEVDTHPRRTRA